MHHGMIVGSLWLHRIGASSPARLATHKTGIHAYCGNDSFPAVEESKFPCNFSPRSMLLIIIIVGGWK